MKIVQNVLKTLQYNTTKQQLVLVNGTCDLDPCECIVSYHRVEIVLFLS